MPTHRHSYVIEVDTADPVRIWTGHGGLQVGATFYDGTGQIIDLPDIKALINGIADRLDITISGVSEDAVRLLEQDRNTIPQSPARIGRVSFDDEWQETGIEWLWRGVADTVTINSQPSDNGRIMSFSFGFASGNTRRSNPRIAFFTDADQRKRSADDAFFSHIGQISAGTTRKFGPR
jgi:hypothetical protein